MHNLSYSCDYVGNHCKAKFQKVQKSSFICRSVRVIPLPRCALACSLYFRLGNSYDETTEGCIPTLLRKEMRWFPFLVLNSPSYPHHPIWRLQNVRHKQISWKTVILKGFLVHIGAGCHLGRGDHESVDQADACSSSSQGLGVVPPHSTTATLLPRFNIPSFPR